MSDPSAFLGTSAGLRQTYTRDLQRLHTKVHEAGRRQTTGLRAAQFEEMPAGSWSLQGSSASASYAENMQNACELQHTFLTGHAQTQQQILDELVSIQTDLTKHFNGLGLTSSFSGTLDSLRARTARLISLFNTQDPNFGHVFGGSQTSEPPINAQLITDLTHPQGPRMSLGSIADYFNNGNTPAHQTPLNVYEHLGVRVELPLQANDCQDIFQMLHDILAIQPFQADEQLPQFASAFKPAITRVQHAILTTSTSLGTLETQKQRMRSTQVQATNDHNTLTRADKLDAAMVVMEGQRSMEAMLAFVVAMTQMEKGFRSITRNTLLSG